jgi:hypothetical protein
LTALSDMIGKLCGSALVLALAAGGATGQEGPMVSRHVFGTTAADGTEAAAERLHGELAGRILYIDWLVQGGPDGPGVSLRFDQADATIDLACEAPGERENLADAVYEIGAPYGDFHTSLIVRPGDFRDFPLSDVACEARGGDPSVLDLRFSGLFFVERAEIPTAVAYSLRPLVPDMATLERMVAAGAFEAPEP